MKALLGFRMLATVIAILCISACDNMQHQENARAFAASRNFADDSSARLPPVHAVSRTAPSQTTRWQRACVMENH